MACPTDVNGSGSAVLPNSTSQLYGAAQSSGSAGGSTLAEELERSKKGIMSHPLYPLLNSLFLACEAGTREVDKVLATEQFNKELEPFIQNARKSNMAASILLRQTSELDGLMVKAVQVLRIHLLELEKVNELCLDFCSRYINCIKTKLNSSTLLKGDDSDSDDDFFSAYSPLASQVVSESTNGSMSSQLGPPQQTASQLLASVKGTTPFSQIGCGVTRKPENMKIPSSCTKRGVLPKNATQIMKSWLFQHIVHPYPTEEEKRKISEQTNLSLLQVNNWFINARRRILQPMLDSGDNSKASKKTRTQMKQVNRFWPISESKLEHTDQSDGPAQVEGQASQHDHVTDREIESRLSDINVDIVDEDSD